MRIFMLISSSVLFSSCMYLGMMGTDTDHQSRAEASLEKEVTGEGVRAMASFPPLRVGEETLFTLRIADARTGEPISGAQVSFHAEYLHKIEKGQMSGHQTMNTVADSIATRQPEQEHDINIDVEVNEGSQRGTYSTQFTPSQSGEHRVMFHIQTIGGRKLEPEMVIEAERTVQEKMSGHDGGMHGMGSATPYVMVGAYLMMAMMIVFWGTGGRMF